MQPFFLHSHTAGDAIDIQIGIFGIFLVGALLAGPLLLERYIRALPVAPVCPSCHSVARQVGFGASVLQWLPAMARTFVAECAMCGWKGRMRWRWARDAVRGGRPH